MENNEKPLTVLVVSSDEQDMKKLEPIVDADIAEFDKYFQSIGNEPVVRSEKAIIKTYLHWKLKGARDAAATGS